MARRARATATRPSPDAAGDTRGRVLAAALDVFAERGFDGATLRDITETAGANIAAVNYYFRSKDELIRQVLEVYVRPIMAARLAALDECQRASRRAPRLEAVVEALVRPMVRLSRDRRGGRAIVRLLLQTRALPRAATHSFIHAAFDPVVQRFVAALSAAIPGASRETLFWRYDFALGAIMQVLTDSDPGSRRLAELSGGACDTDDDDAIVAQLVAFIAAGMRAPPAAVAGRNRGRRKARVPRPRRAAD